MNPISSISASSATSSANLQAIALLQSQMLRYAKSANGANGQASTDYKALQAAIKSGNVSEAQAALTRLQRDSQTAPTNSTSSAATSPKNVSPADSDGDQDGSTGTAGSTENSLNATA